MNREDYVKAIDELFQKEKKFPLFRPIISNNYYKQRIEMLRIQIENIFLKFCMPTDDLDRDLSRLFQESFRKYTPPLLAMLQLFQIYNKAIWEEFINKTKIYCLIQYSKQSEKKRGSLYAEFSQPLRKTSW